MNEINEINEIKIPKGVDSISVTHHDDKIVIEFIPEEPKFKIGDFIYEDGRIMIVDEFSIKGITYSALIYPDMYLGVMYNSTYALTMPLSSLSFRYATEEEKQVLIDALKKDGKRWNAEKLEIEYWLEPWSEEPKEGDLAIFWHYVKSGAIIRLYDKKGNIYHYDNNGMYWKNAIKFESKEQFEKVLRGEI